MALDRAPYTRQSPQPAGPLRILRVERQSPAEVRQLFALLDIAAGQRLQATAAN